MLMVFLLFHFYELFHREWLAMPRVDGVYVQAFQSFDARLRCRFVEDQPVEIWFVSIFQQVAAKQVSVACQDADGTL